MTRAAWWIVIAAAITVLLVGWYVLAGGLAYKPTGVPAQGLPGVSQVAGSPIARGVSTRTWLISPELDELTQAPASRNPNAGSIPPPP